MWLTLVNQSGNLWITNVNHGGISSYLKNVSFESDISFKYDSIGEIIEVDIGKQKVRGDRALITYCCPKDKQDRSNYYIKWFRAKYMQKMDFKNCFYEAFH